MYYLPRHILPFQLYPVIQLHENEPSVLLHILCGPQASEVHSLRSEDNSQKSHQKIAIAIICYSVTTYVALLSWL